MLHSYPPQLARLVHERWDEVQAVGSSRLPGLEALEELLSICYQASLLREEERPVTFRLILGDAERYPADAGPPWGLHRLMFTRARPLDPHELRRLSPAIKYHRALIGVREDGHGGFEIWGLLHSGPRWLHAAQGGRGSWSSLPPWALVIRASGPGQLAVARGPVTLGELQGGRITGPAMDVFEARWLSEGFEAVHAELTALHEEARPLARTPGAELDPEVTRLITWQMLKRLITTIRRVHHGGTLIILPPGEVGTAAGLLRIKYEFCEGEPRRRYRTLILATMDALAGRSKAWAPPSAAVGWDLYESSTDPHLVNLDEAVSELSTLIAGLADVDGAVVLTRRLELLGFGCEIGGELSEVPSVRRALDMEGMRYSIEPTEAVGTRHRSAYRLCQHIHGALVIVVSQDGWVRFVTWKEGGVTYWDHAVTSGDV
ncbi:putative sensor domain DACNV-containing protein [Polyangium sp. 15x6]|uniref:putative sensor domain DACNV-containing protein n=1 Tax=Polyangium sp. 15x6 TaxID=3042687 RepID=UPI00249C60E5|nr:diadenylate cyclase [Polyangium sp. 15x6]MDI3285881.1 diadenylate cyclase [Polyangium sp. 15x6]